VVILVRANFTIPHHAAASSAFVALVLSIAALAAKAALENASQFAHRLLSHRGV
jgi:hypothetical protein